ncbi:MAG: hypothetical protein ABSB35_39885 [Bryobacteraceae bacterium]
MNRWIAGREPGRITLSDGGKFEVAMALYPAVDSSPAWRISWSTNFGVTH